MKIGVQLYSARNYLTTPEGIESAFCKSKAAGYACVQYSGAPNGGDFDPEFLKGVIDKYEMPVCLTHISFDRLKEDTMGEIAKHKAIGCTNIGLGMMPKKCFESDEELEKFVADANRVTKILEDNGCKFFYHNHSVEFAHMKYGMTYFDYLLQAVPGMNITLDTHWVQRGGADVVAVIEKCAGRLSCVHLKDYVVNTNWEAKFAPVGEGNLNWQKILPAFEKAGADFAFVEQDDAVDLGEPFDYLTLSRDNLKKMGY